MGKTLIIEIQYYGLGDHLFHSHIPRIAKETGAFEKVFISEHSLFRNNDNKYIVWSLNPFVDGFVDEKGITCSIAEIVEKLSPELEKNPKININLLDMVMLHYGLDDGKRMHDPEVFYNPVFKPDFNKSIFDPNFFSYVGDITHHDASYFIKKHKIKIDSVMKLTSPKALHKYNPKCHYITTPTLQEFCDLIFSSKKLYCLTSGTATLASALKKEAVVFYGENQHIAFQHSKMHKYVKIPLSPYSIFLNIIKFPYRFIRYKILKKIF